MCDAIVSGIVPSLRSGSGDLLVTVAILGAIDRRVHEHDA
jgi:hypothetical protein